MGLSLRVQDTFDLIFLLSKLLRWKLANIMVSYAVTTRPKYFLKLDRLMDSASKDNDDQHANGLVGSTSQKIKSCNIGHICTIPM